MKNLAAVVMITGMLAISVFGQSSTATRPRVAPTAAPPVIANDESRRVPSQAPPVLSNGRNRPTASPSATPPPVEDADGVIRVETNLVTMPVSVLDRDGRFISGLQQGDFKIFENGVEQKVDYFQSVEQPFTVVLMLDVSPSTQFRIDEIQNAAIGFVDQLRAGDRVMVIAFDENVQVLSPPTNDRYRLRNAIRQAQFGDGTGLYEAVDFVIYQELQRIEGRKAVVLFSDGVDTTSRRASYESTLKSTEEIDALFYTVRYDTQGAGFGGGGFPPQRRRRGGLGDILGAIILGGSINMGGGGGGSSAEYARGRQYLQLLAQNSGGRPFEADSSQNLDIAFRGIAEELRRQYSLGYYPEEVGRIGDRKQIKIRVMRPGVVVRAKNSYIVGQSNRNLAGR